MGFYFRSLRQMMGEKMNSLEGGVNDTSMSTFDFTAEPTPAPTPGVGPSTVPLGLFYLSAGLFVAASLTLLSLYTVIRIYECFYGQPRNNAAAQPLIPPARQQETATATPTGSIELSVYLRR